MNGQVPLEDTGLPVVMNPVVIDPVSDPVLDVEV
jgi:hypothetical protein